MLYRKQWYDGWGQSGSQSSGRSGSHPDLDRTDLAAAAGLFAAGLALYLRTLAPSLLLGDSAELQVLSITPGLAHPTGAPVFLLVTHLFSLLPLGNTSWRVNLASAFFGALAPAILYVAGRHLTSQRWAALVGPLCLAVSQLYWWEAVMTELYAAAAVLIASVLACVLLWRRRGHAGWLFVAGLLGGLSPGVHDMVVLAAPGVLLYLVLSARRRADWGAATVGAATGVALVLGAYLLLDVLDPPASYFNVVGRPSASVWGLGPGTFDSRLDRLIFIISARHFRKFMLVIPEGGITQAATMYTHVTYELFAPAAIGLMAIGFGTFVWRRRREAVLLFGGLLTMLAFVFTYRIDEIYAFFIPTYLFLALLASAGAGLLAEGAGEITGRILSLRREKDDPSHMAVRARKIAGIAVVGLAVLAVVAPSRDDLLSSIRAGRITFLDGTRSAEFPYPVRDPDQPRRTAASIVDRLEKGAIVFTDWPYLYPCIYVAHVERQRMDLAFHMCVPDPEDRLPSSCVDYIRASAGRRPIYFTWPPGELRRWFGIRDVAGEPRLFRLVPAPDRS